MAGNRANRIVKNTFLLYLRSIIIMVLAIYSSRVLLSTLGVEDFGLYHVVGGIVAMFSSIKSVLASSVQRFINFEKGKKNDEAVRDIFCTSILIHVAIALLFVLLLEPIGLWYINNKLVVPEGSLDNALFVFHCSVAATFVSILTIPYDSLVIANEKMSFYAWVSIFDTVLKLLIIFLLPILPYNYLKSYALLILSVTIICRVMTYFYCKRFPESKFQFHYKRTTIKEMGAFAGWNFFGCTASSLIEEGANLIFNAFGGVIANTARGLAYQVRSAVMIISNNVVVASQPYITQQAAVVKKEKFFPYIHMQSKIVFYCTALVVLPLYVYNTEILALWLKEVPPLAVEFTRAVLIYTTVMSFQKSIDLSFKAFGRIARYQVLDSVIALLTLPTVYIMLKCGIPMHYAFYGFSAIRVLDYFAVLLLARKELNMNLKAYLTEVAIPVSKTVVSFIPLAIVFRVFFRANNLFLLMIWVVLLIAAASALLLLIVFNKEEKEIVKTIVSALLRN